MPRASDGLFALLRVEDPKDAAQDWDRAEFARQPEKAIQRTQAWWQQVFGEEVAGINKSYETNPDFGVLSLRLELHKHFESLKFASLDGRIRRVWFVPGRSVRLGTNRERIGHIG
jgi:hypothetical protein